MATELEKKLGRAILICAMENDASYAEMQEACNIAMRAYSTALKVFMDNFTSPKLFDKAINCLNSVPTEERRKP